MQEVTKVGVLSLNAHQTMYILHRNIMQWDR